MPPVNKVTLGASLRTIEGGAFTRAPSNELVTEDYAATVFGIEFGGRFRYCHSTGAWFEFDGQAWRKNETQLAFHWTRNVARRLAQDQPDRIRYVTSKRSFAHGVELFCRADPIFAVTASDWDASPFLLGTPRGTIDLRSGHVRPGDPADGITRLTAAAPADTADCPRWLAFLDEATGGDSELVRFLCQWMGYSLTGDTREHTLVFIHGPGGNGKSVFLNVLTGLLADYATVAAMETFGASRSDRHPTDLAMLHGARLVTASETERGRAWAEARIKQMTGGDTISARFMRRDYFSFKPAFKLCIVGNHQPVLQNVDDAARRRFLIVPFTRKPANPDPELEMKLRQEWPGILRWAVDGCLDWQKNGLIRPPSVLTATADYFATQDMFGQWLADECDVDIGNNWRKESSKDLYASWREYARTAGEEPGTQKAFSETMKAQGFKPFRSGKARGFEGVRLRKQVTDDGL